MAPSSTAEVGTGWFAFYLAKLGGFNLICKEIEVDTDEPDSFAAMPTQIQVNGMTQKELEVDTKQNKAELELIEKKRERRELFLNDMKSLCNGDNAWCIILLAHIKNQTNTDDFHFSYCKKDGSDPTVNNMDAYTALFQDMQTVLQEDFNLTAVQTTRYPLKPSNLAYKVRKEKPTVNGISIRVSTDIICFDIRTQNIMSSMANMLNKNLNGQGILPVDDEDFKKRLFGYPEISNYKNL